MIVVVVESLLRDHITLQVDRIDRLFLNGCYVPLLQRPENQHYFCILVLGHSDLRVCPGGDTGAGRKRLI